MATAAAKAVIGHTLVGSSLRSHDAEKRWHSGQLSTDCFTSEAGAWHSDVSNRGSLCGFSDVGVTVAQQRRMATTRRQKSQGSRLMSAATEEAAVEASGSESAQATVLVTFKLVRKCCYGQDFFVSGGLEALGGWDLEKALLMTWGEGHVWTTTVPLPVGSSIDFKFVKKGRRQEVEWQPGSNHQVRVMAGREACAMVVHHAWDDEQGLLEAIWDEDGMERVERVEGGVAAVEYFVKEERKETKGKEEEAGDSAVVAATGAATAAAAAEGDGEGVESQVVATNGAASEAKLAEAAEGREEEQKEAGVDKEVKEVEDLRKKRQQQFEATAAGSTLKKDAEWGKNMWVGLWNAWGRKPLMAEEEEKKKKG